MKVLATREQKDGSLLIDIEYNKQDKRVIKFITGCKRLTKKGIQEFCEQAIREYVVDKEIHIYRKERKKRR